MLRRSPFIAFGKHKTIFVLVSFVDIVDASQHFGSVMSVWAFQQVPECAIDHAFVATIISLHSESPKEHVFL